MMDEACMDRLVRARMYVLHSLWPVFCATGGRCGSEEGRAIHAFFSSPWPKGEMQNLGTRARNHEVHRQLGKAVSTYYLSRISRRGSSKKCHVPDSKSSLAAITQKLNLLPSNVYDHSGTRSSLEAAKPSSSTKS